MNVGSKLLKRFTLRIKMTSISRWQRLWLGISWSMITGRVVIPTAIEQWNISGSSLVPDKNFRMLRDSQERWEEAESIQRMGGYHQAVKNREEILKELYAHQQIFESGYYPPILGSTWSSNFGHLALIGHHQLAQRLRIIPPGERVILNSSNNANYNLFRELSQGMLKINQNSGTRWSDMPAFWHFSERLRTVKTFNGFIDMNRLVDEIYSESNLPTLKSNYLRLSEDYSKKSETAIQAFGLPKSAQFVAIHIREGGALGDPRTQPIASFIPAISEITRNGYWVIRVGDPSMVPLPKLPMVIDLVPKKNSAMDLHTFVLADCVFYIGTQSGPSLIPRVFGKPSLITNLIDVASHAVRGPIGSIYLPKKHVDENGKALSLMQMFSQGLAFSSLTSRELKHRGLHLESNSSEEILDATKEILESIMQKKKAPSSFVKSVNSIRSTYDSPTWGDFSESYLSKNLGWLEHS